MIPYFIALDYYPYYRLPTQEELNKLNSEAMIAYEEAKSKNILNRLLWTETYFKMREINREARKKDSSPPVDKDRANRLAKKAAPRPLTDEEFDKNSGSIKVPIILKDDIFRTYVIDLQYELSQFVRYQDKSYEAYTRIIRSIDFILSMLKDNADKYDHADYGRAKTYLESLRYEVLKLV